MAYLETVETIIDRMTADWHLNKSKMFGGMAYFTASGNMCFAVMGETLLFRVEAGQTVTYLKLPGVEEARMGSRLMKNWLLAGGDNLADEHKLLLILNVSREFALGLPPKD